MLGLDILDVVPLTPNKNSRVFLCGAVTTPHRDVSGHFVRQVFEHVPLRAGDLPQKVIQYTTCTRDIAINYQHIKHEQMHWIIEAH